MGHVAFRVRARNRTYAIVIAECDTEVQRLEAKGNKIDSIEVVEANDD